MEIVATYRYIETLLTYFLIISATIPPARKEQDCCIYNTAARFFGVINSDYQGTFFIITVDLAIQAGSQQAIHDAAEIRARQQPQGLEGSTVQTAANQPQAGQVQ